jgi:hypothetical protein
VTKRPRVKTGAEEATCRRGGGEKRQTNSKQTTNYDISKSSNTELLAKLGWDQFVRERRAPCDFTENLDSLRHPAASSVASLK